MAGSEINCPMLGKLELVGRRGDAAAKLEHAGFEPIRRLVR